MGWGTDAKLVPGTKQNQEGFCDETLAISSRECESPVHPVHILQHPLHIRHGQAGSGTTGSCHQATGKAAP